MTAVDAALARALRSEESAVRGALARDAGLPPAAADKACAGLTAEAWSLVQGEEDAPDAGWLLRLAGLRVAASALRRHGVAAPGEDAATPVPPGLTRDALRDAYREVIPGRRSAAGLFLRGFSADELQPVYGLDAEEMRSRLDLALESLRTTLHRRAERMNEESWSRALESQPITSTRGMLREGPAAASGGGRLECTAPDDLARAVHGSHFRGGREAALDHAVMCDPCAAELRALLPLRHMPPACEGVVMDAPTRDALEREARHAGPAGPPAAGAAPRQGRRKLWPWTLALLVPLIALALTAL